MSVASIMHIYIYITYVYVIYSFIEVFDIDIQSLNQELDFFALVLPPSSISKFRSSTQKLS